MLSSQAKPSEHSPKQAVKPMSPLISLEARHPRLASAYTNLETLGHGAQGTVLKAKDRQGTPVAIKVFDLSDRETVSDWKAVELLRREVETLKHLNVDGIPSYIDFIEDLPYAYLVESYIAAPSLQTLIDDGVRLSEAQIWHLLDQASGILQQLHQQPHPIIHRDIKPGNILVDLRETDLRVWLVDFGTVTASRHKTQASTVAGTFGYAAPEQFYGRALPSSDIYGLGMTLIHVISGVSPSEMELDGLTLKYEKYLPPNMSDGLKNVLAKMVQPNPKDRFQGVAEMKAERVQEQGNAGEGGAMASSAWLDSFTASFIKTLLSLGLFLFGVLFFVIRRLVFALLLILGAVLVFPRFRRKNK